MKEGSEKWGPKEKGGAGKFTLERKKLNNLPFKSINILGKQEGARVIIINR